MIKQLKIHSLFLLLISLLFVSLIQVHADSRTGSIDIDYKGRTDNQEEIIIFDLDLNRTEAVRRWWPFFRDRRIDAYHDLIKRWK